MIHEDCARKDECEGSTSVGTASAGSRMRKNEHWIGPLVESAQTGVYDKDTRAKSQNQERTDRHYNDGHSRPLSLLQACRLGLVERVKDLLEDPAVDVNARDTKLRRTPLHIAALKGHAGVVAMLLQRDDIEVDLKDAPGLTALHQATIHGHENVVELLASDPRVDLNVRSDNGFTCLSDALITRQFGVARILLGRDGIDVNFIDGVGETPLYRAAVECHSEIVRLLLEREDIDVNLRNTDGRTALHGAAMMGCTDVVTLLQKKDGIRLDIREIRGGFTALELAQDRDHTEIVGLLGG